MILDAIMKTSKALSASGVDADIVLDDQAWALMQLEVQSTMGERYSTVDRFSTMRATGPLMIKRRGDLVPLDRGYKCYAVTEISEVVLRQTREKYTEVVDVLSDHPYYENCPEAWS